MDELNNPTFDCFKEDVVIELDWIKKCFSI
jgi:hypothetical protein